MRELVERLEGLGEAKVSRENYKQIVAKRLRVPIKAISDIQGFAEQFEYAEGGEIDKEAKKIVGILESASGKLYQLEQDIKRKMPIS